MKQIVLSKQTQDTLGYNLKQILTYADLTGESSGATFELFPVLTTATNMPAEILVKACAVKVIERFVAASMTDLVIIIGDGGDTARFLASSEIGGTTTPVALNTWYTHPLSKCPYVYNSADTIDIVATATGATLAALTAGKIEIYWSIQDLSVLTQSQ